MKVSHNSICVPLYNYRDIEDDLLTMEDFCEACANGVFTNYDGNGYLAMADGRTYIPIYPDMINYKEQAVRYKPFTHVVWFNK